MMLIICCFIINLISLHIMVMQRHQMVTTGSSEQWTYMASLWHKDKGVQQQFGFRTKEMAHHLA